MKITDQLIVRFDNEMSYISKKLGLTLEIEHTLHNSRTDVRLSNGSTYKRYVLEWNEVPSFVAAVNGVVRDASAFFTSRRTKDPTIYCDHFEIRDVIFNNPATIVIWADGTKTVVKCQEDDVYSEEVGLALCFAKKALGNKSNFNNVFKKWVPEKEEEPVVVGVDPFSVNMRTIGENAKSSSNILDEIRRILNRPITPSEI